MDTPTYIALYFSVLFDSLVFWCVCHSGKWGGGVVTTKSTSNQSVSTTASQQQLHVLTPTPSHPNKHIRSVSDHYSKSMPSIHVRKQSTLLWLLKYFRFIKFNTNSHLFLFQIKMTWSWGKWFWQMYHMCMNTHLCSNFKGRII